MRRVVICGAGFGGLELAAHLSDEIGDEIAVTLIDKSDSFVFGFSKLDVVFGRSSFDDVRTSYTHIDKPGVDFRQETITRIDPERRVVTTDAGTYEADVLVIALGADYDIAATPGLAEGGNDFYSHAGAARLSEVLPTFSSGHALIGVLGPMFKCPPAPFEFALLLDSYLKERGVRDDVRISIVSPLPMPIPVSGETSAAIVSALDERGISSMFGELITDLDPATKTAHLKSGASIAYDLFCGIPRHKAPDVVEASGMCTDGWIAVDANHLTTEWAGVYAIGDVASAPVPRAGVFAEGEAGAAARDIVTHIRGGGEAKGYDGKGECYIEFGDGRVGKVEADFYSPPSPRAPLVGPTVELAKEKELFASSRRQRWFGIPAR